ncbi:sigma-70 family RNA polymerase sigma factor [Rhodococcus rhodnii]|nr:sigma-70 family RNA polymerase sigma factor [Rhodococcus rhodnii]TXG91183.1 sigma-70 family RNA polymerase sigma factor [Rhodococcus rhodnii]
MTAPDSRSTDADLAAAVQRHRPLAEALARRYAGRGQPLEDLQQVAYCGLVTALRRFDPDRGVRFETYGSATIVGEIRKYFRDCTWPVAVARSAKEIQGSLDEVAARLEARHGRPPTTDELAAHYGVSVEVMARALAARSAYRTDLLDAATEQSARALHHDDDLDRVDDTLELRTAVGALPERPQQLLHMRFVLDMTQTTIAHDLGCSQMQVSRELRATLAGLRRTLDAAG